MAPISRAAERWPTRMASHSFMPWVTLSTANDRAGDTADRADRQVDLAEQQHEDDADGDHAGADHVIAMLVRFSAERKLRVQALEDRPDDDQADDDRQRSRGHRRASCA